MPKPRIKSFYIREVSGMKKYIILICVMMSFAFLMPFTSYGDELDLVDFGLFDLEKPLYDREREERLQGSNTAENLFCRTYDSVNYNKSEGPAETNGYDDKGVSIVKYYTVKDDVSGLRLLMSYYITKNASNKIDIVDEQYYNGYKLADWFTSEDDWIPSDDECLDELYNHKNGLYSGQGAQKLVMEQGKVLHLVYELEPVEKHINIVKFIRNESGEERVEVSQYNSENSGSYNAEVTGCKLIYAKYSGEYVEVQSWEDVNSMANLDFDDDMVSLSDEIGTLYLLYQESGYNNLHLYANELSYRYSLNELTNSNLFKVYNYVPSALEGRAFSPECNGHKCNDSSCDKLHYCTNEFKYLDVGANYVVEHLTDNYNYDINTSFIRDYKQIGESKVKEFVSWKGGYTSCIEPNAEFTLYRQKNRDKVTLYPMLNDVLSQELYKIGLDVKVDSSYKPLNKREAQSTYTEEQFVNTFTTHFEPAYDRVSEVKWVWELVSPYGRETARDSYKMQYAKGHSPDDANSYYSREGNVVTHYFLGSENSGLEGLSEDENITGIKNKDLKFYPYFAMKYMATDKSVSDVYVLSENMSTIATYDNSSNVYIKHKPRTDIRFINRELLDTIKSDDVITEDTDVNTYVDAEIDTEIEVEPVWNILNIEENSSKTECFDGLLDINKNAQVIDSDAIQVPLFSGNNDMDNKIVYDPSIDRQSNIDIYSKHINYAKFEYKGLEHLRSYKVCLDNDMVSAVDDMGFTTSISDAYNSLRLIYNDLSDGRYVKSCNVYLYEIVTDTSGYLSVLKNGKELIKGNSLDTILTNQEVLELDNKTKVITNLFNGLERSDITLDRNGNKWYYEAFNGLNILVLDLLVS